MRTRALLIMLAVAGCGTPDVEREAPKEDASWVEDAAGAPDQGGAARNDAGASAPDATVPVPGEPDGSSPDAAAPEIDAAAPQSDAAAPQIDAAAPQIDAAAPQNDAATPEIDAAAPEIDAAAPEIDAAAPQNDAASDPDPDAALADPDADAALAGADAAPEADPDAALPDAALPPREPPTVRVAYAGADGDERFTDVLALSDGTYLVTGGADDLDFLPPDVPRIELDAAPVQGPLGGTRIGFVLHLAADLSSPLSVHFLPPGVTDDLRRIRTTTLPGEPGGALYVSGRTRVDKPAGTGLFVARLDGDFVSTAPAGFAWVHNLWANGDHRDRQPWDVNRAGQVYVATGEPNAYDWASVVKLDALTGERMPVEGWRYHTVVDADGRRAERACAQASLCADRVENSFLLFKIGRRSGRCDLRSWTAEDYTSLTPDGNGGQKQGRWPADLFFDGPCDPAAPGGGGRGYTGYALADAPTQRIGAVLVDRRTDALYIGFNVQSVLPDGLPDFEPAVLAMDADGHLAWWSRLYTERNADGTANTSTPDQYVDGLALDTANDRLVVLARAHGNNVTNLWSGNAIAAVLEARSYHARFTGQEGNIHISWLGKLDLADGTLRAASWNAEYTDGMNGTGAPYADPVLDGWPDHNAGWPDLNTTRCRADVEVDDLGRVYVLCTGRRTVTTRNAWQRMPQRAEGRSTWNDYVRVYAPALDTVVYSSLLTGAWDFATGTGGDNTTLAGLVPVAGGVLVVGHSRDTPDGAPLGAPVPAADVPAWASDLPARGEDALFGRLPF